MLLLFHNFFTFFEPVTFALDVYNGAMVKHPVKDGGSNGDIGKDVIPLRKGPVRGEDSGAFLIPPGDELEEKIGTLNIHGKVANFVNDEQFKPAQYPESVRKLVLKMGLFQLLNKLVAVDVGGGETVPGSLHTKGSGQMRLANSRRA